MPAKTAFTPRRAVESEASEFSVAQPVILWQALDRLVTLTGQSETRPQVRELVAYSAGILRPDQVERIQDYVSIHPEALAEAGGPPLLTPESAPRLSVEKIAVWSVLQARLRTARLSPLLEPSIARVQRVMRSWTDETRPSSVEPPLGRVRAFVAMLHDSIGELNATIGLAAADAALVTGAVLQSCFPVLVLCREGFVDLAAQYLVLAWRNVGESLGVELPWTDSDAMALTHGLRPPYSYSKPDERHLLWAFQTAVLEVIRNKEVQRRGRDVMGELMSKLDLSYEQVGKMLGVSGETVRTWRLGAVPIPHVELGLLSVAEDSMDRLATMFLEERLPQVIRRQAGLFEGGTALDWILQGRIRDVADRYDLLLRYQA